MAHEGDAPRGGDRRQGDRRQQQVDNLPFPDRRVASRRQGGDRRSHDRG